MPDAVARSAFSIDYASLYEKGFRGIIFDIDNTLVLPDAPADERAIHLIGDLKEKGFSVVILSNNTGERVTSFAKAVGAVCVEKALKPLPDGYRKAVALLGLPEEKIFAVGDQIYTDIWGANRAGIKAVLTEPFTLREEIQIVLKRLLEKPVKARCRKTGVPGIDRAEESGDTGP